MMKIRCHPLRRQRARTAVVQQSVCDALDLRLGESRECGIGRRRTVGIRGSGDVVQGIAWVGHDGQGDEGVKECGVGW